MKNGKAFDVVLVCTGLAAWLVHWPASLGKVITVLLVALIAFVVIAFFVNDPRKL